MSLPSSAPSDPAGPGGAADAAGAGLSKAGYWNSVVAGLIAWAWVIGMGWLYLGAYPPRFERWSEATFTGGGTWRMPMEGLGALGLGIVTLVAAWLLGRAIGARIGLFRGEAVEHGVAILGGLAWIGMGVFALGVVGLLRPGFLIGLLAASVGVAWAVAPARLRWAVFVPGRGAFPRLRGFAIVPAALALLALIVSLVAALTPAVQSDGLRYHLFGPQEYLRTGAIHYIPHSAFTNFPFLVEMLFTLGLGLGTDLASDFLHWVHLPLAAWLVAALASRMAGEGSGGEGGRSRWGSGSCLGAALFVCTPVAAIVAGWPFIDLATTAYFLAMVWGVARWAGDGRRRGDLIAAGFFAGAAIGTKYTMVIPAALGGAIVWFASAPSLRDRVRRAAIFCAAGAICALPWFAKNVVVTRNPVYPLAYGLFDGGDWSKEAAAFYSSKAAEKGAHRGFAAGFLAAPFDTAFYWSQFEAQNPGPGYLLLFPVLVGWAIARTRGRCRVEEGEPEGRAQSTIRVVVVFAIVTGVTFFAGYKSNRFLLPIWALAGALAGGLIGSWRVSEAGGWSAWAVLRPPFVAGVAVVFAAAYGLHWTARYLAAEQHPPPFPVALGFMDREEYLTKALSYYPAVEWLGVNAREGDKAFYIGEYHGYPSRIPVAVSDWFDVPYVLDYIRDTPNNDALFERLLRERYRFVLVNFGELRGYGKQYFQPRFRPEEWRRFEELLGSPRLRTRFEDQGTVVYEVLRAAPGQRP